MPILRNPFRKAPGDHLNDENGRPIGTLIGLGQKKSDQDTSSIKPQSIDLTDAQQQPVEYKLSGTNKLAPGYQKSQS